MKIAFCSPSFKMQFIEIKETLTKCLLCARFKWINFKQEKNLEKEFHL